MKSIKSVSVFKFAHIIINNVESRYPIGYKNNQKSKSVPNTIHFDTSSLGFGGKDFESEFKYYSVFGERIQN